LRRKIKTLLKYKKYFNFLKRFFDIQEEWSGVATN